MLVIRCLVVAHSSETAITCPSNPNGARQQHIRFIAMQVDSGSSQAHADDSDGPGALGAKPVSWLTTELILA